MVCYRLNYPAKTFADEDSDKTLVDLSLVPNAFLTVTLEEDIGRPNATSSQAQSYRRLLSSIPSPIFSLLCFDGSHFH